MSALESLIWTILGYAAMPAIFLFGFIATAVVACILLDLMGYTPEERRKTRPQNR
ncbi:TIGR02808 family protein [Hahella sp. SMD15-11]|uniref:TIGR02808 family protein n=1 Tax=Thermohahella caldifontis TaxID=3142973 RepID=A0AB39UW86_9GAMM